MMPIHGSVNMYPLNKDQIFYDNMEHYISARISCLYDYHIDHDFAKASEEASRHLTEWTGERIIERATAGDVEAMLDMAIRYFSGCGTINTSAEGTLYVLDSLLDPNCDRGRYMGDRASPSILAQAHSCAASAYLAKLTATSDQMTRLRIDERRFSRPATLQANASGDPAVANLVLAVQHANHSARLGLVSPAVLRVGLVARETGAKLGVDMSQMGRSRHMRFLWRALTKRSEEIYAEERKKQKKVDNSPNDYVCAAEGCGIRAEGRAALKACAGACPPDLKPHYCSKACQTKDWPRHKALCKAGSAKAPKIVDKAQALTLFELGDEDEDEDADEAAANEENPALTDKRTEDTAGQPMTFGPPNQTRTISIPAPNAPGGSIQISSSTLVPESMKALREEMAKLTTGHDRG